MGNPRATAAAILGLLSVAAIPAGVALSYSLDEITLLWSAAGSGPAAFVLGWAAVIEARRGREQFQRTLGRAGGTGLVRTGRILGALGMCAAVTAGLAVGFYALLTLFD